jgi:hypothetical protein
MPGILHPNDQCFSVARRQRAAQKFVIVPKVRNSSRLLSPDMGPQEAEGRVGRDGRGAEWAGRPGVDLVVGGAVTVRG